MEINPLIYIGIFFIFLLKLLVFHLDYIDYKKERDYLAKTGRQGKLKKPKLFYFI